MKSSSRKMEIQQQRLQAHVDIKGNISVMISLVFSQTNSSQKPLRTVVNQKDVKGKEGKATIAEKRERGTLRFLLIG